VPREYVSPPTDCRRPTGTPVLRERPSVSSSAGTTAEATGTSVPRDCLCKGPSRATISLFVRWHKLGERPSVSASATVLGERPSVSSSARSSADATGTSCAKGLPL
jgi:hypothetical protein